jgi:hypothetical protein
VSDLLRNGTMTYTSSSRLPTHAKIAPLVQVTALDG